PLCSNRDRPARAARISAGEARVCLFARAARTSPPGILAARAGGQTKRESGPLASPAHAGYSSLNTPRAGTPLSNRKPLREIAMHRTTALLVFVCLLGISVSRAEDRVPLPPAEDITKATKL